MKRQPDFHPVARYTVMDGCSLTTWRNKISVRSFAWHDLITFYRYRRQVIYTDSAQVLTRGDPTGPLAFLSRLNPSVGISTCVLPADEENTALIGQMQYTAGNRSAQIVFLMPEDGITQPGLADLLESWPFRPAIGGPSICWLRSRRTAVQWMVCAVRGSLSTHGSGSGNLNRPVTVPRMGTGKVMGCCGSQLPASMRS